MRFLKTVMFAICVSVFFSVSQLYSQPALAEGLSGAEFKKLVIGNTLHHKLWSNRRAEETEFMYYFINDKKILFSSARSSPTVEEDWSVTDEGRFCRVSDRSGRKRCFRPFRVEGNKLISKSRSGKDRVLILLKGKHVAVKKWKYR